MSKNVVNLNENSKVVSSKDKIVELPIIQEKRVLRDLSAVFFDPVRVSGDDPIRSPLCAVSEILRYQGIDGKPLKSSLNSVLTMHSARLGHPAALMLIDKTTKAQSLLPLVKPFAPKYSIFECMDLSSDNLYMAANELKNKVILNPNFSGLNKVKTDLEHLVEHGYVSRQEKVSSKFRKGIEALEINGPVALVTVTDNPANSNWKGSSMLKIYFSADDVSANIQTINDDSFKVESHRIAKFFERLMPCAVKIPFMNDIFTKMKDAGLPITENLVKPLTNLISLLTIINNPHPVWEDEIIASIYGVDRNQLRNWLTTKGYDVEAIPVNINSAKTATKVEYHLASLLLNGRLEADNEILTERQLRIFSAIKRWNIGRLGSTFADMDNKVEKLSTIARNANSWADRETVFDQVNKDEQDIISLSTINNELQVLMDMDIVQRQKVPKDNKYGYFILTLDAGKTIMLPHASEIADSIFKGEKVQVVNPLTGQIEII
ncbi:MAG: hypothetical protein BWX72_00298 [Firmicutes bacterium ADurb.Bin080]|jgi:predicted transcriptional regulator|nr:MAG: hypothetical protein BWX72_00298 [Firmicutes bacterium ADurb.Bin080]